MPPALAEGRKDREKNPQGPQGHREIATQKPKVLGELSPTSTHKARKLRRKGNVLDGSNPEFSRAFHPFSPSSLLLDLLNHPP
uniref:Uncharacterized protein n=1 Tax=Panagrellus redivivus TaxID=6233 RepID=A0A7E4V6M5_PANRE